MNVKTVISLALVLFMLPWLANAFADSWLLWEDLVTNAPTFTVIYIGWGLVSTAFFGWVTYSPKKNKC